MSGLYYDKKFLYEKEVLLDYSYRVTGQEVIGKLESIWPSLDYSVDEISIPSNSTISTDLYAKKKIKIGSNVIINSGVNLRAGNEIVIDPSNTFNPNISLIVGLKAFPGWEDDPILLHNTDYEISNICNSQKYAANAILNKKDSPDIPKTINEIQMSLFPNPASDKIELQTYFPSAFNSGSIKIYDITGRLYLDNFISVQKSGISQLEIDLDKFSSGVYFLRMDTEIGGDIVRFIIVK